MGLYLHPAYGWVHVIAKDTIEVLNGQMVNDIEASSREPFRASNCTSLSSSTAQHIATMYSSLPTTELDGLPAQRWFSPGFKPRFAPATTIP